MLHQVREWWKPATRAQRTLLVSAFLGTAFLAFGMILPWLTSLMAGSIQALGPVEIEPDDSSPIHTVQVLFLTNPTEDQTIIRDIDGFLENNTFRHIKMSWGFVNGPPTVPKSIPIATDYASALAQNKKAGKVQAELQTTVSLFQAMDTFMQGDAEFLYVAYPQAILSPRDFYKIFRNETRMMGGACSCMKNFGRFVVEAGFFMSRAGVEKAKGLDREKVITELDWRFDVVVPNWLATVLGGSLGNFSSDSIASELPDSDVRLMATDLEFLIARCAGPETMHCGACPGTAVPLRSVGAWPRGDGPFMGDGRLGRILERIRFATEFWHVESIAAGKTQLCLDKPEQAP